MCRSSLCRWSRHSPVPVPLAGVKVLDISQGKNQYLSPRSIAWMGTDQIGRDLFSRLIWGVRTSLFIGVASAILSVIIGTAVGAIAGLRGGWLRGQVLALKEREFIEAARAVGASNTRIVMSHLLPNSIGPILIALTLSVIGAIVGESTLSFFGLGPQPGANAVSLGQLVELSAEGAKQGNWWMVVFPCGALVLLAICINFIGDGMRDAVDSKMDIGG